MDLLASDPTKSITVTVSRDTAPAREAIEGFVQSYNEIMEFIDEQQQFNPESGEASLLFGDRSLLRIRDALTQEITRAVPGATPEMNRLSAAGIRLDSRNRLLIRASELDAALNEEIDGVAIEDVQQVFGLFGETNTPTIRFISAGFETQSTPSGEPYQVKITQTAERARIAAATALPALITIDGTNEELVLKIGSKESDVMKLTQGSYTPQELADHLAETINNEDSLPGRNVTVSLENNHLEILSAEYGSTTTLEVVSGTSLATLGFSVGQKDNGQDVVGEFRLPNGETETAIGSGQYLTGNQKDGVTKGLQVRAISGEGESGLIADVTVRRGIIASLNLTLNSFFEVESGELDRVNETFVEQIDSIDQSIDRLNAQFEAEQQSLIRQFAQLETAVSELQATGNLLSTQLAGLPPLGNSLGN
jgi:flagellar hook-associated protein 2